MVNIGEGLILKGKHIFVTLSQTCVFKLNSQPCRGASLSVRTHGTTTQPMDGFSLFDVSFQLSFRSGSFSEGLHAALCVFLHSYEKKITKYA